MIVQIKCVNNVCLIGDTSDYLTVGKVYIAIKSKDGEFALLCDDGILINDSLNDFVHAKWEIVSD